jgi:epoxyqueuosine reductase QueG
MGLKEDLRDMSIRLGADLFGIASADALNDAPLGHRPTAILPNAKSIIVIGMKVLDAQRMSS